MFVYVLCDGHSLWGIVDIIYKQFISEIKMKLLKFVFISIVLGCLADLGYCDRIKNNIYDNVDGAFCFRRLNGTHQTGCSCKI